MPSRLNSAGATMAVAALLAACGGGGDAASDAGGDTLSQLRASNALVRPELLPRSVSTQQMALAAPTPSASEVLDWAQRQFPTLFNSQESNVFAAGGLVLYRCHSASHTVMPKNHAATS